MEWISVKDRLPSENGRYLVFTKDNYCSYMRIVNYTTNYTGFEEHLKGLSMWFEYDSEWGDFEVDNITHWMELPEEPNE
jgi:hypothetical protein